VPSPLELGRLDQLAQFRNEPLHLNRYRLELTFSYTASPVSVYPLYRLGVSFLRRTKIGDSDSANIVVTKECWRRMPSGPLCDYGTYR
jgi:hypothetical protein